MVCEIREAGGEAIVIAAAMVEGLEDSDVEALFDAASCRIVSSSIESRCSSARRWTAACTSGSFAGSDGDALPKRRSSRNSRAACRSAKTVAFDESRDSFARRTGSIGRASPTLSTSCCGAVATI